MRIKISFIVILLTLFSLVGCNKDIADSEVLVTEFLQEYFEIDYQEDKKLSDYVNDYYFDKMKTYFVEECFEKDFLGLGYVTFPTEMAIQSKSDIKINEITFNEEFEDTGGVGYQVTVYLSLNNEEFSQDLTLYLAKTENQWKIYLMKIYAVSINK